MSVSRIVFSVAFLAGCSAAFAQQATLSEGHLNQLDVDKDGSVSAAEYQLYMGKAFTTLDANSNGTLAESEVKGILSSKQFSTLDANGDGKVSRQEFKQQVMSDFAAADRGNDGKLD